LAGTSLGFCRGSLSLCSLRRFLLLSQLGVLLRLFSLLLSQLGLSRLVLGRLSILLCLRSGSTLLRIVFFLDFSNGHDAGVFCRLDSLASIGDGLFAIALVEVQIFRVLQI